MAIKLLATDLDGTLLNSAFAISPRNAAAIKKAIEAGIVVTFATGRMYPSAVQYADQIGLDVPIITYNGALIKSSKGTVYYERFLEAALVKEVIEYCAAHNYYIQLYQMGQLYFPEHNAYAQAYEKAAKVTGQAVGWQGLLEHTENVPKLLCISDDEAERLQIEAEINRRFGGRAKAVRSNIDFVEIIRPDVNKAVALKVLAEHFGFSLAETLAVGDSGNDLTMLEAAGVSVAVANASEQVKQLCDQVTVDNDHDAIAAILERYVFAKK